jgi:SAM-dependent methyltransferase
MSFDAAAQHYDRDFTKTSSGQWLRAKTWERLALHFEPGASVLEIGCGTGEDACFLAERGVNVLATDASFAMLSQTTQKAAAAGLQRYVSTARLDLNNLSSDIDDQFDGAYSNFGPLNCTNELGRVAQWLAERIRPGGIVALGVMPPFCLWETLWHTLHFDIKTATRRWNGHSIATLADGSTFPIYYPDVRTLKRAFASAFEMAYMSGVGVWLPPSDVYEVIEKRPRLLRVLQRLENRSAQWWPIRNWADHIWVEFKRRSATNL